MGKKAIGGVSRTVKEDFRLLKMHVRCKRGSEEMKKARLDGWEWLVVVVLANIVLRDNSKSR